MKYISTELYKEIESEGEEIDKMLNGYIGFLKKSKQGANEPGSNLVVHEESVPYNTDSSEGNLTSKETTL